MPELLNVRDLKVKFRVRDMLSSLLNPGQPSFIEAVSGVSFDINPGETFGLVGESGSGKTTLGRSLIGLVPPSAGHIRFRGEALSGLSEKAYKAHRKEMTMMFQDPVGCLSPRLKIRSILLQPFYIHGIPVADKQAKVDELLSMVGLPSQFGDRYPHQLSGGQARRVGLARALALSPKLIIADEPTAGLDVSIQGDILNLLGEVQERAGVSVLAITHNLAVIRHVSDRMAIMYLGRFVEIGDTEGIFAAPAHPYTQALLAANPVPDPDIEHPRVPLTGDVPSLMNRPSGCEFHSRCPNCEDICRTEFPEARTVWPGRSVMCHFPLIKGESR
ncbi:MAG: ABC transporter ATP-binding protein [Desulfobacterales bacterium]|nr:ABC transporter ATP-binding protein [Desulfobacterales bacterium]